MPVKLSQCRRTENSELLQAARAVREGQSVDRNGRAFRIAVTPGHANYAAAYLAGFIAWRQGGNVAILTPSLKGGFARKIVEAVSSGPVGKKRLGPYKIQWESSGKAEFDELWNDLAIPATCSINGVLEHLKPHLEIPTVRSLAEWIRRRRCVRGVQEVAVEEIRRRLDGLLAARRSSVRHYEKKFQAMTIQQAKNREFDHVAVVWPYTIPNDDEQKRRLLYNAITRAKRKCIVLVQAKRLADAPPFVGRTSL